MLPPMAKSRLILRIREGVSPAAYRQLRAELLITELIMDADPV